MIVLIQSLGGTHILLNLGISASGQYSIPHPADLIMPWQAGMLFWPMSPISLFLFAYLASGVCSYWFHPRSIPISRQNNAIIASHFLCAPLAWLPIPFFIVILAMFIADSHLMSNRLSFSLTAGQTMACTGMILATWFIFWLNTLRLLRISVDASKKQIISAAIGIPIAWCFCLVIAFGVIPWLVGYIWLMIDSVRQ